MRLRALPLALTVVLITACGSSGQEVGDSDPELVAEGGDLYAANCAQCHGADLQGTDHGPSFLSEVYEPGHHGDAAFLAAAMVGVTPHHWDFGPMPPVEGLTEQDVEAIVAFVREGQHTKGFEPYP